MTTFFYHVYWIGRGGWEPGFRGPCQRHLLRKLNHLPKLTDEFLRI